MSFAFSNHFRGSEGSRIFRHPPIPLRSDGAAPRAAGLHGPPVRPPPLLSSCKDVVVQSEGCVGRGLVKFPPFLTTLKKGLIFFYLHALHLPRFPIFLTLYTTHLSSRCLYGRKPLHLWYMPKPPPPVGAAVGRTRGPPRWMRRPTTTRRRPGPSFAGNETRWESTSMMPTCLLPHVRQAKPGDLS